MDKMIQGRYLNQGEDLSEVLKIREEIFGAGSDEKDPEAVNLLVSLLDDSGDQGTRTGCGRLRMDIENFRFYIDYLGILEPFRRKGLGEFALRALVDKVNQCGADRVFMERDLIRTEEAENFFKKMFFVPWPEDERFLTAEITSFHTCCH
ncbi:MAG: GNAT family N-acetyltransferase [Parasporobacterium sp.]|nr:GNAT family N-acetyltransferase [Parasporobacterium sp.]